MLRILMRSNNDCGIAVLAMAIGITYEESAEQFDKLPITKSEMLAVLNRLQIRHTYLPSNNSWNQLGNCNLLYVRCPGWFRHWIVYLPKEKIVIDPDPKLPDVVTDFQRYKAIQKYISIII